MEIFKNGKGFVRYLKRRVFKSYYYIYLYVAKYFLLKDFLLSNLIVTNYFIIFLQIIDIKNSY